MDLAKSFHSPLTALPAHAATPRSSNLFFHGVWAFGCRPTSAAKRAISTAIYLF